MDGTQDARGRDGADTGSARRRGPVHEHMGRLEPFMDENGRIDQRWLPSIPPPLQRGGEDGTWPEADLATEDGRAERRFDDLPGTSSRRHTLVRVLPPLAALVAVAVAGGWIYGRYIRPAAGTPFTVRLQTIRQVVAAKGKVEAAAEVQVAARMLGRVRAIHVAEGDEVVAGQLLAQMEADELRAQVARARARRAQAQARLEELEAGSRPEDIEVAVAQAQEADAVYERTAAALKRERALFAQALIPRAQVEDAETRHEVAAAQQKSAAERLKLLRAGARPEVLRAAQADVLAAAADLRQAEAQFEAARVIAPLSGRVVRRFMEPGEVVVLQRPQPILTLADTGRLLVRTEVDETDVRNVSVGQRATMRADAYPGRTFTGRVIELGTRVGRKNIRSEEPTELVDARVLEALIELDPGSEMKLGVTVDVTISVRERRDVPVVPASAVTTIGGRRTVRLREGGATVPRTIQTGATDGEYVEVTDGLSPGDVVVLER